MGARGLAGRLGAPATNSKVFSPFTRYRELLSSSCSSLRSSLWSSSSQSLSLALLLCHYRRLFPPLHLPTTFEFCVSRPAVSSYAAHHPTVSSPAPPRALLLCVSRRRAILLLSAPRLAVPLYAARRLPYPRWVVLLYAALRSAFPLYVARRGAQPCPRRCRASSRTIVRIAAPRLVLAGAGPSCTIVRGAAPWHAAPRPAVCSSK